MDPPEVTLQRTDGDGLAFVERLLARNDLPTAGLHDGDGRFFVARDGDDRIGVGGVEQCGTDGLLRSVVVEASVRGEGYGVALCRALEAEARAAGIERLYLLTTTAAEFFAGRGYAEMPREDAPEAIRATTEFAELCPSSATCMRKSLADEG